VWLVFAFIAGSLMRSDLAGAAAGAGTLAGAVIGYYAAVADRRRGGVGQHAVGGDLDGHRARRRSRVRARRAVVAPRVVSRNE
jgi:hypothetical protein